MNAFGGGYEQLQDFNDTNADPFGAAVPDKIAPIQAVVEGDVGGDYTAEELQMISAAE